MKRRRPRPLSLWPAILLLIAGFRAAAPAAKLDPASREFYQMARHFMTRDEEKVFRNLISEDLRQGFIEAFWEIRDPDPLTPENEFRRELEERYAFINKYLRENNRPGWRTDRGMVYLVLGPPSMQTSDGSSSSPSAAGSGFALASIAWSYDHLGIAVWFVDRRRDGVWELDTVRTPPRFLDLMQAAKIRALRDGGEAEERFLDFKARFAAGGGSIDVSIPLRKLRFDAGSDGTFTALIHLAANVYPDGGAVITRKEDRRIAIDPQAQEKGTLEISWALPLPAGRYRVDLLVLDQVGGLSGRQLLGLKKK